MVNLTLIFFSSNTFFIKKTKLHLTFSIVGLTFSDLDYQKNLLLLYMKITTNENE